MLQFLNNIWNVLCNENETIIKLISLPACSIEAAIMYNFIIMFSGVKLDKKINTIYTISLAIIGVVFSLLIPAPVNTIIYYLCILIFLKILLHVNLLKSILSIMITLFLIALTNMLTQKPFQLLFHITNNALVTIPIYRFTYLIFYYMLLLVLYTLLNKIIKREISLSSFDILDKKTIKIVYVYIIVGFVELAIQLLTTAFYIDTIPIIISIFNFGLLLSLLILSIYTFSRVITLATTKQNLQTAKEYNKSLEILYDEVKGFNHDFKNIISTIDGYIDDKDFEKLRKYVDEVKEDCKITNNLSILNPRIINNPGIYSLLNNKYFKATNAGIKFDLYFFLDLNTLDVNSYKFSRILGVLLDNAIEEAEKCEEKIINVSFRREEKNHRAIITIENTYTNKDVNIDNIFKKGVSGKENHSGIGLWEVRKYVKNSRNLDLFTSKTYKFFKQELTIYD